MESLLFQLSIAALAVGGLVHNLMMERYQGFLLSLCKHLARGTYDTTIHPQRRLWRKRTHSYHTFFRNRPLTIQHTFQPELGSRNPGKTLELRLGIVQKFWLRLLTDRSETVLGEDIQVGDPGMDRRCLIHSNQPEAATEFLNFPDVRSQIERLAFLFSRLEFHQGVLRLQYTGPVVHTFNPESLQHALEAMIRIADSYEARSAFFRLLVVPVQNVCPYCRSELASAGEPVVECQECRTRLHHSCWDQNGQCTTYGCQSRSSLRSPGTPWSTVRI